LAGRTYVPTAQEFRHQSHTKASSGDSCLMA
jgi:hypothetical protein